jgi:hypothetical protein
MAYNTPWNPKEDEMILEGVEAGKDMDDIASELNDEFESGRSGKAVYARYMRVKKTSDPTAKTPKRQKTIRKEKEVEAKPKIFSPGMGQYQINILDSQGRTVMLVHTDANLKDITNALKEVL